MRNLEGIFPIVVTAFTEDGKLDLNSQARLVEYLLEQGSHGLGLLANASEGYTLTGSERITLLKEIRKQINGRVPLVVSSGHTGTDAAVELCREAEENGADAVMVLPPYFLKTDADGLMFYFEAISDAIGIPIMVQDAPLMTGVAMPAGLMARMGREIERVRYAKVEAPPTAPKISALGDLSDIVIFGGLNGQFLIEELERGALGTMPGSDMTADYVEVWNRLRANDRSGAWERFTRMLPLVRFELQPGMGVSAMKHNLVAAGIIRSAKVRHPTAELDSRSLAELEFLRQWTARRRHESTSDGTSDKGR